MKYGIMGLAACLAVLLIAVTAPALVSEASLPERVWQHEEATPAQACPREEDGGLCSYLPIVEIDTGGVEIPGRSLIGDDGLPFNTLAEDGQKTIAARMRVIGRDCSAYHHQGDAPDVESAIRIRIRGNSSRDFDKPSYAIRLVTDGGENNPQSLMGMDAHHEWVLHGPWLDKTALRNYLFYNLSGEIMGYAPNVRYCELVVDGAYQGLYLLTESITAGRDGARLQLNKTAKRSVFTGYLLRLDHRNKYSEDIRSFTGYTLLNADSSLEIMYLTTTVDATPFEAMLAELGDRMLAYESSRYGQQRLFAFSNWPTTDPFEYPEEVKRFFRKCACVDVEHIRATDKVISGQIASYHVYPYYQDFLSNVQTESWPSLVDRPVDFSDCFGADGSMNTYRAYLKLLSAHHAIPVVITEFGVSTGRGMAQRDANTGRNQGNMSEREQGDALVACWEDLRSADCSGGCVFSWQDEWFKRTWNTMHAVDLSRTPYWSDYQTNEQYFGLLSFDPGAETWACALDGDISEWSDADVILSCEDGSSLSMKYDERYLYFRIHRPNLAFGSDTLVLPIDVTPKTGSTYSAVHGLQFERACDFLIVLHGREDSRVLVQDRCNALMANYSQNVTGKDIYLDPPDKDSPHFEQIHMILQTSVLQMNEQDKGILAETFETGLLRYGDGNPDHAQYDSLADFICRGDEIELRLPWQLLNFADPSRMSIHDDCYDGNYGIEFITAEKLYVGLGALGDEERIAMGALELTGWGNRVQYHERLKPSYFILQDCWTGGGA